MQVYDIIQSLIGANSYDEVIVKDEYDENKEYEITSIRTDNGFVEIKIKEKENKE